MYDEEFYTCLECGYEWESKNENDTYCPICHAGNINKEEDIDD